MSGLAATVFPGCQQHEWYRDGEKAQQVLVDLMKQVYETHLPEVVCTTQAFLTLLANAAGPVIFNVSSSFGPLNV